MGWIKTPTKSSKEIFSEIVKDRPTWNGRIGDSTTPYEYWIDWLRDNYDLTMKQADEVCRGLKEYYHIEHFYYGE